MNNLNPITWGCTTLEFEKTNIDKSPKVRVLTVLCTACVQYLPAVYETVRPLLFGLRDGPASLVEHECRWCREHRRLSDKMLQTVDPCGQATSPIHDLFPG